MQFSNVHLLVLIRLLASYMELHLPLLMVSLHRVLSTEVCCRSLVVIRVDQSLLGHNPEMPIIQQWKKFACPLALVDLYFAYVNLKSRMRSVPPEYRKGGRKLILTTCTSRIGSLVHSLHESQLQSGRAQTLHQLAPYQF